MKIYDLDKLIRDINQDNLYNFFDPTFTLLGGVSLSSHVVSLEQEMRMDLVSQELYSSSDFVDFLLHINDIDNPLNIKQGDIIVYPPITTEPDYRVKNTDNNNVRARLLNVNKSTKKDENRKKYIEDNFSLPPTFLKEPEKAVKIVDGQIVIGG